MASNIINRLDVDSDEVSTAVLHHIDTMYPAMWKAVPKSARDSLRKTIVIQVELAMQRAAERSSGTSNEQHDG